MKIIKKILAAFLCLCLIAPFCICTEMIAEITDHSNEEVNVSSCGSLNGAYEIDISTVDFSDFAELYNLLMQCTTLGQAHELLNAMSDEDFAAFEAWLSDEQLAALNAHMKQLIANADANEGIEYAYVQTVDFTNVAPIIDTVPIAPFRGASAKDGDGLVLVKNAVPNGDGTYTITLEAYTTGTVTTETTNKPTDIVLVLDQSGSMRGGFGEGIRVGDADTTLGEQEGYYATADGEPLRYAYVTNIFGGNGRYVWQYSLEVPFLGWRWYDYNYNDNTLIYVSRRIALQETLNNFVAAVNEKAKGEDGILGTDDDVKHRIAVVGFASESGNGNNTELLSIKGSNSGNVGIIYSNNLTQQNYRDVLQDMTTDDGRNMVQAAINALAANGATEVDLGMDMANGVFENNPLVAGEQRNRVVIVFTDGSPTSSNGFETATADKAISKANIAKNSYGATVYGIGIFDGANGTPPSGNQTINDLLNTNKFMHLLSSNYPDSTSMDIHGEINGKLNGSSYYLSASNSTALDAIFESIQEQISSPTIQLGSETQIVDVISPYFTMPGGANGISIYTADCTGTDENGFVFDPRVLNTSLTPVVNGTPQRITVSGFNFDDNFVSAEPRDGDGGDFYGRKLIIEFTVGVRPGFLGGNDVPTNGTESGVYTPGESTPVGRFNVPVVNVPIPGFTVNAVDKNVYLFGSLTPANLMADATATFEMVNEAGQYVTLNFNDPDNYGLEEWQTACVDITTSLTYGGNVVVPETGIVGLTGDTTAYRLTVTLSPKPTGSEGAIEGESAFADANINVFKPELTFKDSNGWYGDIVPAHVTANLVSEIWKHGDTVSTAVTMIGDKPTLALDYTYATGTTVSAGDNDYIVTTNDIPVMVNVYIGTTPINGYTTFAHQACAPACPWSVGTEPNDPAFLIHVNTCSLTIDKELAAGSTLMETDQTFIFTVQYAGIPGVLPPAQYNVAIQGDGSRTIVGLPVGSYTVSEDENWSWRYNCVSDASNLSTMLSATNAVDAVIVTNELVNYLWISDEASATNRFSGNTVVRISTPAIVPGREGSSDEA